MASDLDAIVREMYADIGRTGIGDTVDTIDQAGYDYWKGQLESGASVEDVRAAFDYGVQQHIQDPNRSEYADYVADYVVQDAYGSLGRGGFGSDVAQIDQGGYDYWTDQLTSGGVTISNIEDAFANAVNEYITSNPNDAYTQYVSPYVGMLTDPTNISNIETAAATAVQRELGRAIAEGDTTYVDMLMSDPNVYSLLSTLNFSEEGRIMDPTEIVNAALYQWDPNRYEEYIRAGAVTELGDMNALSQSEINQRLEALRNDPTQTVATMLQGLSQSPDGIAYDPTGYVFGGFLDGTQGAEAYQNIYTDLLAFANRTGGFAQGYDMGPSPWKSDGNGGYIFDPSTIRETGALPGYGIAGGESSYGKFGKMPGESLTAYYKRLAATRDGGILGQGLLSASPTVGSEAYDAMQQIQSATGNTTISDSLANVYLGANGSLTDNRSTSDEFGNAAGSMALADAYRVYGEGFTTPEQLMFAVANKVFPGSGLFGQYAIENEADRAVMNDLINQGYQPGGTSSNENMYSGNDPSSRTDISAGADQYD